MSWGIQIVNFITKRPLQRKKGIHTSKRERFIENQVLFGEQRNSFMRPQVRDQDDGENINNHFNHYSSLKPSIL